MQPIGRASAAALANSTDDQAAAAAEESAAGPSSSSNEYSAILGNIEIPEGVDPSFLAALPEEMRQEVIAEHLRLQRVRQRASDDIASSNNSQVMEVNSEFLAALPPNIQGEVLAQPQLERQQVGRSNPDDPIDPVSFLQSLKPPLRQTVRYLLCIQHSLKLLTGLFLYENFVI